MKIQYLAHLRGGSNYENCKAIVKGACNESIADKASVVLEDLTIDCSYFEKITKIAQVWKVNSVRVERMLDSIGKEVAYQRRGGIAVFFSYERSDSILSFIKYAWSPFSERLVRPENCLTWAKKKLAIAGIDFELSKVSVLLSIPNIEM